jgi:GxxExxY protein
VRSLVSYLRAKGLQVETEKQVPIYFSQEKVGVYTPDISVNGCIFLELKCKSVITRNDIKQFWYYLKATGYPLGFLINFGAPNGVEIIRRIYKQGIAPLSSASVPCASSASVLCTSSASVPN